MSDEHEKMEIAEGMIYLKMALALDQLKRIEKLEQEMASWPDEEPVYSLEHQRRMAAIFAEARPKPLWQRLKHWQRLAAALLLMLSLLGMGLSIEASRVRIVNFIMEIGESFMQITRREEGTAPPPVSLPEAEHATVLFRRPTHLPAGYSVFEVSDDYILYSSAEGDWLEFMISDLESGVMQLDVEDRELVETTLRSYKAFWLIAESESKPLMFYWEDEQRAYLLSGYLAEEEMLRMAESIYDD